MKIEYVMLGLFALCFAAIAQAQVEPVLCPLDFQYNQFTGNCDRIRCPDPIIGNWANIGCIEGKLLQERTIVTFVGVPTCEQQLSTEKQSVTDAVCMKCPTGTCTAWSDAGLSGTQMKRQRICTVYAGTDCHQEKVVETTYQKASATDSIKYVASTEFWNSFAGAAVVLILIGAGIVLWLKRRNK